MRNVLVGMVVAVALGGCVLYDGDETAWHVELFRVDTPSNPCSVDDSLILDVSRIDSDSPTVTVADEECDAIETEGDGVQRLTCARLIGAGVEKLEVVNNPPEVDRFSYGYVTVVGSECMDEFAGTVEVR